MKNLILCSGVYENIDPLLTLISSMEFEDNFFGKELNNFHYIPNGLEDYFSEELNESVEISPNTGVFRKPLPIIHYETFYQHSLWLGIVALEDTVLTIHKQEKNNSFFDVSDKIELFIPENCFDSTKWDIVNKIYINKNNFVFIRPWVWHSLQENSLVQIFLLNTKVKN